MGTTTDGTSSSSLAANGTTDTTTNAISSPAEPQPPIIVKNGEEGESCTLSVRLKLFRLVESSSLTTSAENGDGEGGSGVVVGVPPANRGEKEGGEKEKEEKKEEEKKEDKEEEENKKKMEWKEVGTGPFRILEQTEEQPEEHQQQDEKESEKSENESKEKESEAKTKDSKGKRGIRLVQRRESTPGGQGTKLILNLSLKNVCDVTRKSEKFVQFSSFEAVVPEETADGGEDKGAAVSLKCVQYLLKAKTVMEADSLQQALQKGITDCCGKD